MNFLRRSFSEAWKRTEPFGAFDEYDVLKIIIDILGIIENETFPEAVKSYVVANFVTISNYLGNIPGDSFKAYEYWKNNKSRITKYMEKYLKTYADNIWNLRLKKLL